MKNFIFLFILFHQTAFTQELKEIQYNSKLYYYYFLPSKAPENTETLLFLHGSMSQFKNLNSSRIVPLDSLLEMNTSFLSTFKNANFSLIIPIASGEMNWLNLEGEKLLDEILKQENIQVQNTHVSGFSDGGTGAYRYFYSHPNKYKSLLAFNAYPHLENFYKSIDYTKMTNKKVVFLSQDQDKVIPYEYLLLEYRRQKSINDETYFILRKGKHEFAKYDSLDFNLSIQLLKRPVQEATSLGIHKIYPAIDGLIIDNVLLEVYPFRKAIGKKYDMNIKEYMAQDESYKLFNKHLKEGSQIRFLPIFIRNQDLKEKDVFTLDCLFKTSKIENEKISLLLDNYIKLQSWEE